MSLDQRMAELLGDELEPDEHTCPVFLEMPPETARVVAEGLRCALYGGAWPRGGRRALLLVMDGLTEALAT